MSYSLGIGGSERQLSSMACALDRSVFTPHVACFRGDGFRAAELRSAGVPILNLPIRSFASWSAVESARMFRRYLAEHRISLVHTFDFPTASFAVPLARMSGVKTVLSSLRCHRSLVHGWHRHFTRVTDRLSRGIVVNCKYVQNHLHVDEGVPAGKIHLCYNGLDSAPFSAPRTRLPALEDASVVIGTVSVLRPEKGLDLLIDAFAALKETRAKLVIVGSGEERPRLEAQVARLGIGSRVLLQPAVENVAAWLGSLDIFVLPSRSEALSNALMEAMASGCACIASNVGGNPELIASEEIGVLFESGNRAALSAALNELASDADRRTRLGAAAAARIRGEFTLDRAARRLAEIYRMHL